jgi:hypothetical protein
MPVDQLTHHAQCRIQQRGIPAVVIDYLSDFGSIIRCNGADRMIFDKAAQKRLRHHLGGERGLRMIEAWFGVYAIVADEGGIITVAHQKKRHLRN